MPQISFYQSRLGLNSGNYLQKPPLKGKILLVAKRFFTRNICFEMRVFFLILGSLPLLIGFVCIGQ
jgi:hypothetical protein